MLWIHPVLSLLAVRPSRQVNHHHHPGPLQEGSSFDPIERTVTTTSSSSRRQFVTKIIAAATTTSSIVVATGAGSATLAVDGDENDYGTTVTVKLGSPQDRLGLELYEVDIGSPARRVIAIGNNNNSVQIQKTRLQAGMVLKDFNSMEALKSRIQNGPYPVELTFRNLAAGGDAFDETGVPLVGAQDALNLARSSAMSDRSTATSDQAISNNSKNSANGFKIEVLTRPSLSSCKIQSRRNDVLEINYTARYDAGGTKNNIIVYDSSERRGTGQPYQMVLGSGDMLTGVDLGLYDMCPGEQRQITIPPRLAYGRKGNQLFGIPPDQTLVWEVELVRINGVVGQDKNNQRSRDEMEERVPYSTTR